MATISCSETFAKRRAIFLSVRETVNIQGYSKLREPIKTREIRYPRIWYMLIAVLYLLQFAIGKKDRFPKCLVTQ